MPSARLLTGRRIAPWLILAVIVGAEFLFFDRVGAKRHTWIYPRWNDQIQYLTECYTGFEYLKVHGFWAGLWQALVNPSAQGTLHDFLAMFVFSIAGPSRSAALSLNMFALIAWQVALFVAVWRGTRSQPLAWGAAILPIALRWPWNGWAGSAIDFRLDHLAMCSLGCTLAVGLLTAGFRSIGWSLLFGFAVGWTLLLRFITGPYFVLIFAGLFVWLACTPERIRRIRHLLFAGLVATVIAGPILWLNREWVWNYYAIGHFTGPESAIRNPHMGLGRSLNFVWGHLFQSHLGAFFWFLTGGGAVVLLVGACLHRGRGIGSSTAPRDWWPLGAIFLLAPALILTLHQQKSEIVVGALVPGVVVLVVATWAELQSRCASQWPARLFAIGSVVAGGWFFSSRQLARQYDQAFALDARKVNALADYIFTRSREAGLANPRIGVDQVTDCLDGQVLRVICYERKHVWVPFIMTLPTGITEAPESLLMERLANSDFIFLTEAGPSPGWPYDRQMRALLPRTQAWCAANLQRVERFSIFGKQMVLYRRPPPSEVKAESKSR